MTAKWFHAILDQAFVCSVGFVVEGSRTWWPTNYVRGWRAFAAARFDRQPIDEDN